MQEYGNLVMPEGIFKLLFKTQEKHKHWWQKNAANNMIHLPQILDYTWQQNLMLRYWSLHALYMVKSMKSFNKARTNKKILAVENHGMVLNKFMMYIMCRFENKQGHMWHSFEWSHTGVSSTDFTESTVR